MKARSDFSILNVPGWSYYYIRWGSILLLLTVYTKVALKFIIIIIIIINGVGSCIFLKNLLLMSRADIPKLCSAEHQVLREASPSAPQRDWKEK